MSTVQVEYINLMGSCPLMAMQSGPQASRLPCLVKGFWQAGGRGQASTSVGTAGEDGKGVILHSSPGPSLLFIPIALQHVT